MSLTRPPVLTPEELDRLFERMADRGAKIQMLDPRVTSVQTWILTTVGMCIVGTLGMLINSVNNLNQSMTRVVTQNEFRDEKVNRIENHVEILDGRIVTLERKAK